MKTPQIACVIAALSLTCFSLAEAQSEGAPGVDAEVSTASDPAAGESGVQEPVAEPVVQEPAAEEPIAQEPAAQEPAAEEPVQEPVAEPAIQEPTSAQVHLRFRAIRLYAGAELQMAPSDAPSSFEALCELPCNVDVDAGVYHLNVLREDGRAYALPTSINFDVDARISLKYGASTASWVGGIVALTGILGILITGGIAIAGAANDNSGQTTGGLVGLGLSSLAFGAGLATFLLSERGLRAQVLD